MLKKLVVSIIISTFVTNKKKHNMPKDRNIVILDGIIGTDFKYGRMQDRKEYATFSLCMNTTARDMSETGERTSAQTYVRIFVNHPQQIEYLRKVKAHGGMRASIYGRLTSFKNEYKGNSFMTLNVISRDLEIIQTKPYNNNNEETKETEETNK